MPINLVVEMGRLTAQPELKTTPNGTPVLSFTIAVPRYNKDGTHPEANFIDCVAWKNTAEFISKYFSKGERILIQGSLETRVWEDKEGKKRKSTEVTVEKAEFVERKSDSNNHQSDVVEGAFEEKEDDRDLPF